jgi:membrane protein
MAVRKITQIMEKLRYQCIDISIRLNKSTHGWLGIVSSAVRETLKPNTAISAAAIAYFALFSLFPFIMLCISIASFKLSSWMNEQFILKELEFIVPALGKLLGNNIDSIILARGPVTSIALVGLIWSASTIFYMFNQTLNDIWKNIRGRPVWKRRGLAILFVLAIIGPAFFLASLTGSIITYIRIWIPVQNILIGNGINSIAAILIDVLIFMILYSIFPHGAATWHEILPGAIGAGLFWELAKKGFLFFISTYLSVSNLVYGSVTAIIAVLVWAYLSGLIFLFGAFLSVAYYQYKQQLNTIGKITKLINIAK